MSSKILVLGASGMLGGSLISKFNQKSIEYITHSRNSQTDYNFELSNNEEVLDNLAANTNVDICENNPKLAYRDNVASAINIANWIELHKNKTKLIHLSTDQVYDNNNFYASENDVNLSNYYAYSKYCAELYALKVNSVVLRTNFFGKSIHDSRMSLSDWIISSLANEKKITLFNNIYFNPISISSLVNS